jgi:hypothetical protein
VQQPVAVPEVQPTQQSLMAAQTAPVSTRYKPILDALTEVLQKEGAQEFQCEFFDQVDQHSAG